MQFPCPTCRSTLSLPDDSAGKKAQCPSCQAVFRVPETVAFSDRSPTNLLPAIVRPGRTDAVACPGCDKLLAFNSDSAGQAVICPSCQRRVRMPTSSELFGGQEARAATKTVRPFQVPVAASTSLPQPPLKREGDPYAATPLSSETYHSKSLTNYTGPGWGLFGVSLLNLGYVGIIVILLVAEKQNADAVLGFVVFLLWGAISATMHATSLIAGLRMTQRRSLSLARLGAILGLIPCGICSFLQLPFAIWALITLYNADAPRDFTD